jgi:hypothetical protein
MPLPDRHANMAVIHHFIELCFIYLDNIDFGYVSNVVWDESDHKDYVSYTMLSD